jgi:hypothetical protein
LRRILASCRHPRSQSSEHAIELSAKRLPPLTLFARALCCWDAHERVLLPDQPLDPGKDTRRLR